MSDQSKIFKFNNGLADVWADPLEINARLNLLLRGQMARVAKDSKSADPDVAWPALLTLRDAVCVAFGLGKPFDPQTGTGVQWDVWRTAWRAYLDFFQKPAADGGSTPISPEFTASAS